MSEEVEFDFDSSVDLIADEMSSDYGDDDNVIENDNDLDLDATEEEAEEPEEEAPEVEAKAPPASWSKEQHENWSKLPREAQDYIELREKQVADGMNGAREAKEYSESIKKTIEPYREMLNQHGVDEKTAIGNLLGWNKTLQSGTIEQRQNAFIALGNNLGIIPQEGQPQVDPRTQELQQRIDRIEQQENNRLQSIQKENYSRVAQEVEAFATGKEDFDLLGDDITLILKSGVDLETAYEKARWANPVTRAKALAESVAEQTKAINKKSTEAAKSAIKAKSTNVRQTKTNHIPAEPVGSWEDTMSEALSSIKSR